MRHRARARGGGWRRAALGVATFVGACRGGGARGTDAAPARPPPAATARLEAGAPDAGAPDAGAPGDAARGGRPAASVRMFLPCASPADCADGGAGANCLAMFPGGLCSVDCRADEDCGDGGTCYANLCLPRCTPGGGECARHGAACERIDRLGGARYACVPSCAAAPGGDAGCARGLVCDVYTGRCTDTPTPPGGENGAPCEHGHDCRGDRCLAESEPDAPSAIPAGFVDGYCYSYALQPGADAYRAGAPLPRSNCPAGSVVPPPRGHAEGDRVPCWRECTSRGDCRAGYACDRFAGPDGRPRFATGICRPVDCARPGARCPAGFACRRGEAPPGDAGAADEGRCVRTGPRPPSAHDHHGHHGH